MNDFVDDVVDGSAGGAALPGAYPLSNGAAGPAAARQHNPCDTCSLCCRSYIVPVCGYDVWLICTEQRLSPEQFLVAWPQEQPSRDGFLLQAGGPILGLMLDKQGPLKAKQPCVFLVRLGGGHDRCGVYAHRPAVCQTYPMAFWHGDVMQRDGVLCPPDSWPAGAVRQPAWRTALLRQRMHYDIYRQAVLRWNARVAGSPQLSFGLAGYYNYLLNVYDRLARLDGEIGETQLARVRDGWGKLPRSTAGSAPDGEPAAVANGEAPRRVSVAAGDFPWVEYLMRAKAIIDGFFPDVERQPLRLPATADETGWGREEPEPALAPGRR